MLVTSARFAPRIVSTESKSSIDKNSFRNHFQRRKVKFPQIISFNT
jgi:hypothetical protein